MVLNAFHYIKCGGVIDIKICSGNTIYPLFFIKALRHDDDRVKQNDAQKQRNNDVMWGLAWRLDTRPYGTALLHWFALRFSFYRRSALCNESPPKEKSLPPFLQASGC